MRQMILGNYIDLDGRDQVRSEIYLPGAHGFSDLYKRRNSVCYCCNGNLGSVKTHQTIDSVICTMKLFLLQLPSVLYRQDL